MTLSGSLSTCMHLVRIPWPGACLICLNVSSMCSFLLLHVLVCKCFREGPAHTDFPERGLRAFPVMLLSCRYFRLYVHIAWGDPASAFFLENPSFMDLNLMFLFPLALFLFSSFIWKDVSNHQKTVRPVRVGKNVASCDRLLP